MGFQVVTPDFSFDGDRLQAVIGGETSSVDWVDLKRAVGGATPGFAPFWWGVVRALLVASPAVDLEDRGAVLAALSGQQLFS
jgi:hypothetical protein